MKRYLIYIIMCTAGLASFLLSSCIDEYNAELPDKDSEMLVVEGSICSDSTCLFRLTKSVSLDFMADAYGERIPVVSGAEVAVCGTDGSRFLATETVPGQYSVSVQKLKTSEKYWLSINTKEGLLFESDPATPLDAPSLSLHHEQLCDEEQMGPVDIYLSTCASLNSTYFSWRYDEWWEVVTPYIASHYYDDEKSVILPLTTRIHQGWGVSFSKENIMDCSSNYVDNSIDGFRLVSIPATSVRLNHCYYIKVYQDAISESEYKYEEARRKQSDEMGGLFTPQPSQLPTNIHCKNGDKGVIGYVGVRGRVTVSELYLRRPNEVLYQETRKIRILEPDEVLGNQLTPNQIYRQGYRVLKETQQGATWISRWCIDCKDSSWGTVTCDKPDFWNPPTD